MGSVQDLSEPTAEHTFALFESIEQKFPNKSLGEDKWYLVAVLYLAILSNDEQETDISLPARRARWQHRATPGRNPLPIPDRETRVFHSRLSKSIDETAARSTGKMRVSRGRVQAP